MLLDRPANLGLLTMNALHAADEVLVPVSMQDEGAFNGIAGVVDKVAAVARRSGRPRIAALVRTRVRDNAASFRELDEA